MCICIWKLPKHAQNEKNIDVLDSLIENIKEQRALATVFLLSMIGPDYGDMYVYFLRKELEYTPTDFAWIGVSSSLSFLLATITFNRFLLKENFSVIIMVGIFGSSLFKLTQLLVVSKLCPYFYIVLGDGIAESFFGQLMLMPLIVLAAKGCKEGVEGSVYALLMSICNFSNILGSWLGGLLGSVFGVTQTNFDNLLYVMIIGIVLDTVIPLYAILRMFSVSPPPEEENTLAVDHMLEPLDPEVLSHKRDTPETEEANRLARSASTPGYWGKRPWRGLRMLARMRSAQTDHTSVTPGRTGPRSDSSEITSDTQDLPDAP